MSLTIKKKTKSYDWVLRWQTEPMSRTMKCETYDGTCTMTSPQKKKGSNEFWDWVLLWQIWVLKKQWVLRLRIAMVTACCYICHCHSNTQSPYQHSVSACCSVLQRVAMCCSVLQCVAVCCSVLQCGAVRCSLCHSNTQSQDPFLACCHRVDIGIRWQRWNFIVSLITGHRGTQTHR